MSRSITIVTAGLSSPLNARKLQTNIAFSEEVLLNSLYSPVTRLNLPRDSNTISNSFGITPVRVSRKCKITCLLFALAFFMFSL